MLEKLTEEQAKAFYAGQAKKAPFTVYRKKNDNTYAPVGKVYWSTNYNAIPIKQKYWPLIYFHMEIVSKG